MVTYILYFTGTAIINQFIDEAKVTELRVSTKTQGQKQTNSRYCTKVKFNLQLKMQPVKMNWQECYFHGP